MKSVFDNKLQINDQLKLSKRAVKDIQDTYTLTDVEKIEECADESQNQRLIDAQIAGHSHLETQDEVSLQILELQTMLNSERSNLRDKLSSLACKISGKAKLTEMNP